MWRKRSTILKYFIAIFIFFQPTFTFGQNLLLELTTSETELLKLRENNFKAFDRTATYKYLLTKRKKEVIDYMTCSAKLSGEITEKSVSELTEKLRTLKIAHDAPHHNITICLNSTGGSLKAAIRLAKAMNKDIGSSVSMTTLVLNGDKCLSACALIFMLGYECFNSTCYPSRYIQPRSKLGFHSPYLAGASTEAPSKLLDFAYQTALKQLSFFLSLGNIKEFVDVNLRYPQYLLPRMLSHGRNDFFMIEKIDHLILLGINLIGPTKSHNNGLESLKNYCNNQALKTASNWKRFWHNESVWKIKTGHLNKTKHYSLIFETVHWSIDTVFDCNITQSMESFTTLNGSGILNMFIPIDLNHSEGADYYAEDDENNDIIWNSDNPISIQVTNTMEDLYHRVEDPYNSWIFWPGDTRIEALDVPF